MASFRIEDVSSLDTEKNVFYNLENFLPNLSANQSGIRQGPINPSELSTNQTSFTPSLQSMKLITNKGDSSNITGYIPMQMQNLPISQTSLSTAFKKKALSAKENKMALKASSVPVITNPKVCYVLDVNINLTGSNLTYNTTYNCYQTIIDIINQGFNVINIAFLMSGNSGGSGYVYAPSYSMAQYWQTTSSTSLTVYQCQYNSVQYANSKGVIVLISAGGATDYPMSSYPQTDAGGNDYGTDVANWAGQNNLNGVDFDIENFATGFTYGTMTADECVSWVGQATIGGYYTFSYYNSPIYISHSPQAPYFGPYSSTVPTGVFWTGTSGGYTNIYNYCALSGGGNMINWFNVQYYNQGNENYTSYNQIFVESTTTGYTYPWFPGTAIEEVAGSSTSPYSYQNYGSPTVPQNAMIVGGILAPSYGSSGYNDPTDLGDWIAQAGTTYGYVGGAMVWQFTNTTTSSVTMTSGTWLSDVY
jgi:hypothetical protein